jgi:hypothetical protein
MWTNSLDKLASSAASFSSFSQLQSQLDMYADDNSSTGDIDYSQDTLAASSDTLGTSKQKLLNITSGASANLLPITRSPIPPVNKSKQEVKSTDTIYLENLKI